MQESSWVYLGTVQITLVFIKMVGKPVHAKGGIRKWVPYPSLRGRDSIINIENWDPIDRISHIAPCVVIAIRIFLLLTDPNNVNFQSDFDVFHKKKNCQKNCVKICG